MLMMGSCFRSRRFFPSRRISEFFGVIIIFNHDSAYHDVYAAEVIHGLPPRSCAGSSWPFGKMPLPDEKDLCPMKKEKIVWKSAGLRIFGEMYHPAGSSFPFPSLVICHGIPGKTRGTDDPGYPALAERFCRAGFLAVIFNFRGTGESEGNFDLLGWANDLESGLDYLKERPEVDRRKLYLMGFSGGGAVSIYVAARRKEISGVISCASPAEFDDLASGRTLTDFLAHSREVGIIRDPLFPPSLPEWKKTFETVKPVEWIAQIPPRPLLLIQGTADDVVEPRHARLLYERVKGKADFYVIEGAGHRLRLEEQAMDKALKWMKKTAFSEPGQNRLQGVGGRE